MKDYTCALITGASAGLGEEFARQLAPRCETIILVARRADRLAALAAELHHAHGTTVRCFETDLAQSDARLKLAAALADYGLAPDLLINNAGLGDYGSFTSAEWDKTQLMIRVNMEALTHLCHLFLPAMISRQHGGIINVSSLASCLPMKNFAVYAATKAYVTSFSEALRMELRTHKIKVTALCPGPVHTEFGQVAERNSPRDDGQFREWFYVEKQQVVSEALAALEADAARIFPGWKVALAAAGIALVPLAALRMISSLRDTAE